MDLLALDTPALVVDLTTLENNLIRMQQGCNTAGVDLRPHAKTHKTRALAQKQIALGAIGLTVAKTREAEILFPVAGGDILVANQVVAPPKIRRLFTLAQEGTVGVLVDSLDGLKLLANEAKHWSRGLDLYIEVNITDPSGLSGRCGVAPGADCLQLARQASDIHGVHLRGIMGYRGVPFLFASTPPDAGVTVASSGKQEGELLVEVAQYLRSAGVPVERVLAGSTATALAAASVSGVSEVHPGEYVFYGGTHSGPGVCSLSDCALWVMATVVSTPHKGRAVIDAGKKALSGDTDPRLHPNLRLKGYGLLQWLNGQPIMGANLTALSEEHGVITLDADAEPLHVGDIIRVIPNHVCPVVNLFNRMWVHQAGNVVDEWTIDARGAVD